MSDVAPIEPVDDLAGEPADDSRDDLLEVLTERLAIDSRGLLPAIVQDASSSRVLMLAWMDAEALRRTLTTRRATYWSRSRQIYWVKGETSGNTQHVREVRLDCDRDTVLLRVDQRGPACHTGAATCFDDDILLADDILLGGDFLLADDISPAGDTLLTADQLPENVIPIATGTTVQDVGTDD